MIARAVAALWNPAPLFRHLAAGPRRPWAAFTVLVLNALASNAVAALAITRSDWPQIVQAREVLQQVGLSADTLAIGMVISAPLSALLTWPCVWSPIRMAAGRAPRLWEVAAWSQLPSIAIAPVRMLAAIALTDGSLAGPLLVVASAVWSAALVFTGVRDLSGGRARAAAIVHALLWSSLSILGLGAGGATGPTPVLMGG